jgi:hypothetical protein
VILAIGEHAAARIRRELVPAIYLNFEMRMTANPAGYPDWAGRRIFSLFMI